MPEVASQRVDKATGHRLPCKGGFRTEHNNQEITLDDLGYPCLVNQQVK